MEVSAVAGSGVEHFLCAQRTKINYKFFDVNLNALKWDFESSDGAYRRMYCRLMG